MEAVFEEEVWGQRLGRVWLGRESGEKATESLRNECEQRSLEMGIDCRGPHIIFVSVYQC